jgi:pimeloyl-ACP methyl ester carboxylesterase
VSASLKTAHGQLRVRDTGGKGPVVLMTPDGPNVIEHHDKVIELLAPHARVICFDMPGFGFSKATWGYRHRLEQGASVVLSVMDALNVREASLLFSCGNGFFAMAAAKAAPQRIRSLILAQTPGLSAMPAWTQRNVPKLIQTPIAGQITMKLARRKFAHAWYGMAMNDKAQKSEFRAIADHALTHGGCFCLADLVQGLSRATAEQLSGVKQPTTLIWGDSDRSHKQTRAESLLELLPQAEVRHCPECGHFPDLEQPQAYAELALKALNA